MYSTTLCSTTWFGNWTVPCRRTGYLRILTVLLLACPALSMTASFAAGEIYNHETGSRGTRMWLPDDLDTVKGILILGNGGNQDVRDYVNLERYRAFGKLHDFAVIGTSLWGSMYSSEITIWEEHLAELAQQSGRPELVNAPWAPVGISNGGSKSYGFNLHRPEKVLAFILNKAGGSSELPSQASLKTPGILIYGEYDIPGLSNGVIDRFEDNRPRGALWSLAQEGYTAHFGMAERLVLPLMDEAIRLRYPAGQLPTATSGVDLLDLDETSGWLADQSTWTSQMTEIASYADYSGDRSAAGWLLNEGMANLYRAFTTHDKQVYFDPLWSPTYPSATPDVLVGGESPQDVVLEVGTHAVPDWSKVELFDYDESIAEIVSDGSPSSLVRVNAVLTSPRVHGLYALVTHADGVTVSTTDAIAYIVTPDPNTIVPEPNTLVLLASGALGLLIWFRRNAGLSLRRP